MFFFFHAVVVAVVILLVLGDFLAVLDSNRFDQRRDNLIGLLAHLIIFAFLMFGW